jgi:hypothetical protein
MATADGIKMSQIQTADLRVLIQIRRLKFPPTYLQNWQYQPLLWKGQNWNYAPFPIPPLARKVGEDSQSITYTIPNISSSQHGNLPIRDWVQDGSLSRARVTFYVFTSESTTPMQHNFVVAERIFDENESRGQIQIKLRNPKDRNAIALTKTFTNAELGELANYY